MTFLGKSLREKGSASSYRCHPLLLDCALLVLRLGFGLSMAFGHGFSKLEKFWTNVGPVEWADPLGMGAGTSLALAGAAEFLAALLVAVGLMTRLAALAPLFTMAVALGVIHVNDPWSKMEPASMYLYAFLAIALAGAGRISLDHLFFGKKLK
jgi:putative oxidoreductase